MAKFCTKCGRRLIDGQPCSCTQTQQPVHDMQESVQKEVKDKAKNFCTQALEMIKHPSTGFVEAVSDKDSKNGLILMGIEAVLTGLYLYVLLQKIVSATMSGINSVFGTSRTAAQTPSLGGFFGYGIIIAIIVSLVIATLVMGLMKAMAEADINWFQSCQIAGMRSLGLSLGWILGILGLFLGMYQFAILIIVVGGVLGDDLYDRCNDELSEYEERYDRVCCVDHYIGRNIHIIFCFERVCFIITDQQWRVYNQFFK